MRVEGRFTGEIESEGTLNVGKDAHVQGTLDVGELLLSGHFNGEVTAKRRVVVYASGVLEGSINTPSLLTEEGGIIEGQIAMRNSGKTRKENSGPGRIAFAPSKNRQPAANVARWFCRLLNCKIFRDYTDDLVNHQ